MRKLLIAFDGDQHRTALNESQHKSVAIDCLYTGKGEIMASGKRTL